jgi:hypothetical protein
VTGPQLREPIADPIAQRVHHAIATADCDATFKYLRYATMLRRHTLRVALAALAEDRRVRTDERIGRTVWLIT